jgi:hypothetical protein
MKKTIWKYPLSVTERQRIQMPQGAEILTIQTQAEQPCIWVIVDPEQPKEIRYLETFETGQEITDAPRKYLGSYQLKEGKFVFHVFECPLSKQNFPLN